MLEDLAADKSQERIRVGDLVGALGDRATAALIFVLAAPNVLPTPPGVSLILGLPILLLSIQLMLRRPPRLPEFAARRSLATRDFSRIINKILPGIRKAENLLAPRVVWMADVRAEPFIGGLCVLMTLALFLPVPFGSMLPSLSICMLSLGVMERDGIWVIGGLIAALLAVTVVSGVVLVIIGGFLALFT